ncbi:hypothetical protein Bca101_009336 [Brassica carinata]
MFCEGRRSPRSMRQGPSIWFSVLVLSVSLPYWLFHSPAMSREESPTAALLCLSEVNSVEPLYYRRRTSHTYGSVQALQSAMEHNVHHLSSLFLHQGRAELKIFSGFAPLHFRRQIRSILRPDPSLFGKSSTSLDFRVMCSSLVGGPFRRTSTMRRTLIPKVRRSTLTLQRDDDGPPQSHLAAGSRGAWSPLYGSISLISDFKHRSEESHRQPPQPHLVCPGDLINPLDAALFSTEDLLVTSVSHSRSTASLIKSSVVASPVTRLFLDGFIECYKLQLLPYQSLEKSSSMSLYSPSSTTLQPCFHLFVNLVSDVGGNPLRRPALSHLFVNLVSDVGGNPLRRPIPNHRKPFLDSMNGENFSDSFPSFSFSLLTGLLSCGAVRTGPEDAIKITSIFFVGEDCFSTSLVTISQLSDFVVKAFPTHSNIISNSISSWVEDLSRLGYLYVAFYAYGQRGWIIPSFYCTEED